MKKFLFIFFITILAIIIINKNHLKSIYYYAKKNYLTYNFSKCINDSENIKDGELIIIAGHSYGHPSDDNTGTYPGFLQHLKKKDYSKKKIILAGDIVNKANYQNFIQVQKEFQNVFEKVYVAPGNHDVGLGKNPKREIFLKVFENNYDFFEVKNNIFFVLDTALESGSISNDQLALIKKNLSRNSKFNNIFIITHHVIWQNFVKKKITSGAEKNFFKGNNFESLKKIFEDFKNFNKLIFISGDVSVTNDTTKLFCEKNENFYYLMTGMGNKNLDNYIKIFISLDGKSASIYPVFF